MNTKNILLVIAGLLIVVGVFKPNIDLLNNKPSNNVEISEVSAPVSEELRSKAKEVTSILKKGGSDRRTDGKRLSSLALDMGVLVGLDGDSEVIKNTEAIRQANKLAGPMLRMDIKNKYTGLAEASEAVIIEAIGADDIIMTKELRSKAVQGFEALAWAYSEGAK